MLNPEQSLFQELSPEEASLVQGGVRATLVFFGIPTSTTPLPQFSAFNSFVPAGGLSLPIIQGVNPSNPSQQVAYVSLLITPTPTPPPVVV